MEPGIELRRTITEKVWISVIERISLGEKLRPPAGGIPRRWRLAMTVEPGIESCLDGRGDVLGGVTELVQKSHAHVGQDVGGGVTAE